MKKVLCVLLAAVLCLWGAGCGEKKDADSSTEIEQDTEDKEKDPLPFEVTLDEAISAINDTKEAETYGVTWWEKSKGKSGNVYIRMSIPGVHGEVEFSANKDQKIISVDLFSNSLEGFQKLYNYAIIGSKLDIDFKDLNKQLQFENLENLDDIRSASVDGVEFELKKPGNYQLNIKRDIKYSELYKGKNELLNKDNNSVEGIGNDALPHNSLIHLTDNKESIEKMEDLKESEYGLEGVYESTSTWHVENSDYTISYSFADDGSIQYVSYILVDSDLSDIELEFTEVTTRGELWKIYGDGENYWEIKSNDKVYYVTLKRNDEDHSILLNIMTH